jgi:methionyl-tRNA synthetase
VIARFMRLSGREVFFLSGTDEHGQKVEQTAKSKGMEPQEFVDSVSVNFRDLLELLNISNDAFIRTTEDHHKRAVLVSLTPNWLACKVAFCLTMS